MVGDGATVLGAEQEAVVPPFDPTHVHDQEVVFPATLEGEPAAQRLLTGLVAEGLPLALPQTPFTP